MTKKIMFLLTASILSLGIMTGCSDNSGTAQSDDNANVVTQTDNQNVADDNADDNAASATESSVNTVVGTGQAGDDNADDGGSTAAATTASGAQNNDDGYISEEEASSIALAEVSGATAEELRIHKDNDDGRNIYEGSIYHDGVEYDFEIDAASGAIIDWSSEMEDDDWNNGSSNAGNNGDLISEKKARNIALDQVSGATENDIRIHQDNDDGRTVYEGTIVYNEMEYDFEIDAQTGDIIDWSSESIYDD
ncbi:MAG TPA: PepSY domain-containing protein [Candidatus Anaerobutyricum avicola]|nr:PepSY domain-containing protein [Candidatus Anaerobutyricum avicola]